MAKVSYRPLTADDYDQMAALWKENGTTVTAADSRTNTELFIKRNMRYCF